MDVTGNVNLEIELKVKKIGRAKKGSDILSFLGIKGREYFAEIEFWQHGKLQDIIEIRRGDSIKLD